MSQDRQTQQGFSTVELLIALFIAAAFIATAFELFSVVMNDGNETRLRARAGNIAHDNIRRNSDKATIPCSTSPVPETQLPSDLPQLSIEMAFSCPYGENSRVTRITATVQYGQNAETVEESLDVYQ